MLHSVAIAMRGEHTTDGAKQLLNAPPYVGSQIAPPRASLVARSPEAKLMLAVLDQALEDVRLGARASSDRAHALGRDAHAWIDDDDTEWPYSFVNVCGVLQLDPSAVRRQVRAGLPAVSPLGHHSRTGRTGIGGGYRTRVRGHAGLGGRKAWV